MPPRNVTVAHTSPLISYVPGMLWSGGAQDTLAGDYWSKGYHATNASEGEGRLFFTWFGTDIWVFGGYRPRLGPYRVRVDGNIYDLEGYQPDHPMDLDAVLFNSTRLHLGTHQIEIINTSQDNHVLDVSRIQYQHHSTSTANITAADARCGWSTSQNSSSPMWVKTSDSMTTYSSAATMNITFNVRTGISLYGAVGPSNSPFAVSLNGVLEVLYPNSQQNMSNEDPQLLFIRDGLPSKQHVLTVRNNPMPSHQQGAATTLNIHHAVVLESSDHQPPPPESVHTNVDRVVDILAGAVALVVLTLVSVLIWRCIRARKRDRELAKKTKPRPFVLLSSNSNRRPLSKRLSDAFTRIYTRPSVESNGHDTADDWDYSQVATQGTSPSQEVPAEEYSPTPTLYSRVFNPYNRKARQSRRPRSMSSLPLVQNIAPPPPAFNLNPWPGDHQTALASRQVL